jgi:hypothetical protein
MGFAQCRADIQRGGFQKITGLVARLKQGLYPNKQSRIAFADIP